MIVTGITRAFQLIFAAVVFGASISAIKDQVFGHSPATTNYSAFAGAFGLLAALVGIAALFVETLAGPVGMALDALASIFLLAGGIAVLVKVGGVSCSSSSNENLVKLALNALINGGHTKFKGQDVYGFSSEANLKERCRKISSIGALEIIGAVVSMGLIILGFLSMRRATRGGSKASMI